MSDIRESILARLHDLAKTVVSDAQRMDFSADLTTQPNLVLVDGEENLIDADPFAHSSLAPVKVQMEPHFALLVLTSENAGPALSAIRANLIKAVLSDEQLSDLTALQSGSRKIGARFMGSETGVQMGEGLVAFMTLRFALIYHLKPTDL